VSTLARLFERHHRLVRIGAFAVCLLFGVRAMADMIDAVGDASAADEPVPARAASGSRAPARPATLSKSGAAMAERNIFCSACVPASAPAAAAPIADSGIPPATSLPLRLIATHVAGGAGSSSATILHDVTGGQGAYGLGDRVPGAGNIVRIGGRSIDFENPAASRVERLAIADRPAAPPAQPAPAEGDAPPPSGRERRRGRAVDPELQARLDDGVRAIDDTTFEVKRKLIEDVLARPQAAAGGARVVPRPDGLRVMRVRPDSAHARLGLRSGDSIHAVNGIELSSPDKMLEAITQLRNESNISLSITRRGEPVTLKYTVR
jgi:general secretion pathway protein C